jgi:hypothetical protein
MPLLYTLWDYDCIIPFFIAYKEIPEDGYLQIKKSLFSSQF